MPRIQIYITDDLAEMLKKAQVGPYKLNVSQVCREALEKVLKAPPVRKAPTGRVVRRTPRTEEKPKETVEERMERGRAAMAGAPVNDWMKR